MTTTGKLEFYKKKQQEGYCWRLKSSNGDVVSSSLFVFHGKKLCRADFKKVQNLMLQTNHVVEENW